MLTKEFYMLKLFISYSHKDESKVENFLTYINPLITGENKLFDAWYDRNIKSGDDFWKEIENHLKDRDIVCLFISKDYIASKSCVHEMEQALQMRKMMGTLVIPVILSTCRWQEMNSNLGKLLAATKDAKPIDSYENEDKGWDDVYEHIKEAAECYRNIKDLEISDDFLAILNDASLLTKAHSQKAHLTLDDIYVNQELTVLEDTQEEKKTTTSQIIDKFDVGSKYSLVGDDQSGKSSILKRFFCSLKNRFFIPIYVKDSEGLLQGQLKGRLEQQFKIQYNTDKSLSDFSVDRIVPLIDDFHKTKNKEKVLHELQKYRSCVLVVDDIFSLDVINEQLVIDFSRYRIRELKASLRNKLIKKWLSIREGEELPPFSNAELAKIDEMTSLVEQSLGKAFGKGIMPAHPFFILYVLSTYDFEIQPADNHNNITSQGHCYQALIYFFLRSQGVDNENIDGYLNFFTEFAYALYENQGNGLNPEQYEDFVKAYNLNFNFVESKKEFNRKVFASGIISISSFNTYSFGYPYLYYFFAGRYFAEQWNDTESENHTRCVTEVNVVLTNLHKTSNAYIAIFLAHHTKSMALQKNIIEIADNIFSKFEAATLDKKSLAVFGKQSVIITQPALPKRNNVELNRETALKLQDELEEQQDGGSFDEEEVADELSVELRRSVKTVEVMGAIIKNRAGSLGNEQLKKLFLSGVNVHLRLLTSFLLLIERITEAPDYSDFLIERIRDKYQNYDEVQLKQTAKRIFWGVNFAFIIGTIRKTAQSLGSSKIANVVKDVCDAVGSPASYMIKHTILMWKNKNLRIDELMKMDKILDNPVAKSAMLWLITEYCSMHRIDYKDTSKLGKLGIKSQSLLPKTDKDK